MSRYPVSPRPVRPEFKGKFAHQEGYVQRSDGHWVIDPSATVWVRDPETALAYDTEPGSENWSDLPDSTKRGIEDFNDWLADPDRLPTVKKHQDGEPIARSDDEMRAEFVAVHKEQHLREWGNRDVLAVVEPAFDAWSKRPENAALKNSSSARFVNLYNSTEAA